MFQLQHCSTDNSCVIRRDSHIEKIPREQAEYLCDQLKNLMEVHKYYLNPFISAEDVALKLNVHRNIVSYIVNQLFGMNFRDFLNEFRLADAYRLILDEKNKKATVSISAIIESAGFYSISTYYRAKRKSMRLLKNLTHEYRE
jgi:AraC-like DNA-binding protein